GQPPRVLASAGPPATPSIATTGASDGSTRALQGARAGTTVRTGSSVPLSRVPGDGLGLPRSLPPIWEHSMSAVAVFVGTGDTRGGSPGLSPVRLKETFGSPSSSS